VSEGPEKHWVSVAGAVLDDTGRILAIRRRDNNRWEPPGGILELDEGIHEGLIREISEETGLRVSPIALCGVYKNMRRGIVALVFRCGVVSGRPLSTEEAAEVRFLTPDEVRELMDEAYACRLLDALEEGVSIRTHDGVSLLSG
jgi:ADP-ribose pyrophosphatase YjhB (NUDIX family)